MTSRAGRNEDRMVTAAEAVRILSASAGGAAGAQRELARRLHLGTLIAQASRLIHKTTVSPHRTPWLNQLQLHHDAKALAPLLAVKAQIEHFPHPHEPQHPVPVPATFWWDLFFDDGELIETSWHGIREADWSQGNFVFRVCLRQPTEGVEGDPGDWREATAIDVRFPAARLASATSPEMIERPTGRPKGSGGWAVLDAPLIEEMHEMLLSRPDLTAFRAALHFAAQAEGGSLETRQRRLAKRYRARFGGK